jgi:hypothetical protein
VRNKIYLTGILLLVIGLSFSRAFVSISYVILIATWLADRNVFKKFGEFFRNKPALVLTSIYLMHLGGLLYTSDFEYAWLDIRTKVPILILPLVFSTMKPLSKKEFIAVLIIFSLSVVASFGTSLYFLFTDSPVDFRETFHFVSHIRLSLMAVIAISVFVWLSFSRNTNLPLWTKAAFMFLSGFLLWAVIVLEIMSGMLLFLLTSVVVSFIYIFSGTKGRIKLYVASGVLITTGFVLVYLWTVIASYNHVPPDNTTGKTTAHGNRYANLEKYFPVENGSPIGRAVCWKEMKQGWNQRSDISFDSLDENGNKLKYTLLRYLNSKHLSKDYEGVKNLTNEDIKNIEQGFANVEYTKKFSIKKRIYKVLWEYNIYEKGGNMQRSSGIKRLFLWETGIDLIKQNPLFGVGTGDVKKAFEKQLEKESSPLAGAGLRSHNQFITIAVVFGVSGLLWFVFALFYPFIKMKHFEFLFLVFFVTYVLSMFWEDSLETQIGVTIFAFFYPFYLFLNPYCKKHEI